MIKWVRLAPYLQRHGLSEETKDSQFKAHAALRLAEAVSASRLQRVWVDRLGVGPQATNESTPRCQPPCRPVEFAAFVDFQTCAGHRY